MTDSKRRCSATNGNPQIRVSAIGPVDVPGLIVAELVGAAVAGVAFAWVVRPAARSGSVARSTLID